MASVASVFGGSMKLLETYPSCRVLLLVVSLVAFLPCCAMSYVVVLFFAVCGFYVTVRQVCRGSYFLQRRSNSLKKNLLLPLLIPLLLSYVQIQINNRPRSGIIYSFESTLCTIFFITLSSHHATSVHPILSPTAPCTFNKLLTLTIA